MPNYIVNLTKDNKGYNEVHTTDCTHGKKALHTTSIGYHLNEIEAVKSAKNLGYNADGCYYCCNKAHKG